MAELKNWNELLAGGTVVRDDAPQPETGGWRTGVKPEVDLSRCVNCLLCWLYCPDSAVAAGRDNVHGLRPTVLQGLRDLRRDVPGGCDHDGSRGGAPMIATEPRLMTGGEAVAYAMRQIDPDVVPVYPITPQTPIIQGFAKFVADGKAHTEVVNVESEHSAMSAAVGSALAGARTMTATSSQGLALMAEVVYIAAAHARSDRHGGREPRALRADQHPLRPLRLDADPRLRRRAALRRERAGGLRPDRDGAANRRAPGRLLPGARLPGRLHDHTLRGAGRFARRRGGLALRRRVPVPIPVLDAAQPTTQGPFAMPDYYFELRRQQAWALETALDAFAEVAAEFEYFSGRGTACSRPTGSMTRSARSWRSARRPERSRTSSTTCATRAIASGCSRWSRSAHSRPSGGCLLADLPTVIVLDRADSPGGAPPLNAEVAPLSTAATSSCGATSTASAAATCIRRTFAGSLPERSPATSDCEVSRVPSEDPRPQRRRRAAARRRPRALPGLRRPARRAHRARTRSRSRWWS